MSNRQSTSPYRLAACLRQQWHGSRGRQRKNHQQRQIRLGSVTAISVKDGAYKVGSYDSFSGAKSIALKINGCVTKGAGAVSITGSAFPVIAASGNLPLTYFAKVSGDAPNSTDVNAMSVVFTISIVD
jgi:hypothetical protein